MELIELIKLIEQIEPIELSINFKPAPTQKAASIKRQPLLCWVFAKNQLGT